MKIKRLEISGFKSFADKVVLDFQQGVTGVVGPNGCGKSNVVDAIRWCMGEQSAKNLRGKAMEDVIFAGSETRKPLGMAEVSLIFSTEDGRAPAKYLDYAEIQLTRRLYRDGESDYLINKTPCRLLDITELFMDTGVGTRAYSIIEQGKIGMILHSRPEERRFLIEEAAGVTKFKSRKNLALKKIEATRQNLSRLTDVLGEIRRQLVALQRQAKKAEKFREFRDELREIDLLFTAGEYRLAQQQRAVAEQDLAALNERIRTVFASSSLSESQVEKARLELLESEKKLNSAQEEIYRIKGEFGAAESGLEFQRKELSGLTGRMMRLEEETAELAFRLKDYTEQHAMLELKRDASAEEALLKGAALRQAEEELAGHQQSEDELNRLLEGRRKELFAALSESAQFKNRYELAQKRLSALSERLERSGREGVQLAERLEVAQRRVLELNSVLAEVQQEQEALKVHVSALRRQEDELKAALPGVEKNWQSCRDDFSRTSSRLHSLQELEAQFAGYGQGVKALMKSAELKGCFSGLLADVLTIPEELEASVEAVLADRLQCVLCADDADVVRSLEFLKSSNGGRVGLVLPLVAEPQKIAAPAGVSALAEMVAVGGEYGTVVRHLLAGVMVVEALPEAIVLARKHPQLSFVTRSGDVVSYGSIVNGGSADQVQKGIIHKKREIRDLELKVVELEGRTKTLSDERDALRRKTQETAEELKNAGADLHRAELKLAGLRKDSQQATDEISRVEERLSTQAFEAGNLEEEKEALQAELKLSQERMTTAESVSKGLEQETAHFKAELELRRSNLAKIREQVTEIRVQVATHKEQHEAHLRGIIDLENQRQDLERRLGSDREQLEKGTLEKVQLQEAITVCTERLESLVISQARAEKQLAAARETYEEYVAALSSSEAAAKKSREDGEDVRRRQSELNLSYSTLSMQMEHLERSLQERSRITMTEALERLKKADFDEAERRMRKVELQRLLDEMGEVNLMAIEECAAMEQRYDFLSTQREDLEESMRSLQQAIQRINRTTRQRFLETYNLVNAKFQEVFPRLFCGGCAELRLTNEEDLLETGIEIIVQPPGKKQQNVMLLSGGEKALTAVALIFSIFLIKPTPFCLLDEVDAPLDDANIGRFNEMVREMSAISQFIIITHNKATMLVADTLYGITMESPGASKVVSVRLH